MEFELTNIYKSMPLSVPFMQLATCSVHWRECIFVCMLGCLRQFSLVRVTYFSGSISLPQIPIATAVTCVQLFCPFLQDSSSIMLL